MGMAVESKFLAHHSKTQQTFRKHIPRRALSKSTRKAPPPDLRSGGSSSPNMSDVVAVIDDDAMVRKALEVLLSSFEYTVELYASGEAFLERAAACTAMCLLIDVQLGSSSGIELARQLAEAGLNFPIMFMTANVDKALQRQALEVGCVAYLQNRLPRNCSATF